MMEFVSKGGTRLPRLRVSIRVVVKPESSVQSAMLLPDPWFCRSGLADVLKETKQVVDGSTIGSFCLPADARASPNKLGQQHQSARKTSSQRSACAPLLCHKLVTSRSVRPPHRPGGGLTGLIVLPLLVLG